MRVQGSHPPGTLQMALGASSPAEVISDGCSAPQLLAEQSRGAACNQWLY